MSDTPSKTSTSNVEGDESLRQFESNDPLAELARLVSGDNPFSSFEPDDGAEASADASVLPDKPEPSGRLFTAPVEDELEPIEEETSQAPVFEPGPPVVQDLAPEVSEEDALADESIAAASSDTITEASEFPDIQSGLEQGDAGENQDALDAIEADLASALAPAEELSESQPDPDPEAEDTPADEPSSATSEPDESFVLGQMSELGGLAGLSSLASSLRAEAGQVEQSALTTGETDDDVGTPEPQLNDEFGTVEAFNELPSAPASDTEPVQEEAASFTAPRFGEPVFDATLEATDPPAPVDAGSVAVDQSTVGMPDLDAVQRTLEGLRPIGAGMSASGSLESQPAPTPAEPQTPEYSLPRAPLMEASPVPPPVTNSPASSAFSADRQSTSTMGLSDAQPQNELVDWEKEIAAALSPQLATVEEKIAPVSTETEPDAAVADIESQLSEALGGVSTPRESELFQPLSPSAAASTSSEVQNQDVDLDPFADLEDALASEVDSAIGADASERNKKGLLATLGLAGLGGVLGGLGRKKKSSDEDLYDAAFEDPLDALQTDPDAAEVAPIAAYEEQADYNDQSSYNEDADFEEYGFSNEEPEEKKSSRGMLIAASALLLVVLGGAGAYVYSLISSPTQSDGEIPTIAAQTEPIKVEPEEADQPTTPQDSAVFDRASGADSANENVNIVPREEPVVALQPPNTAGQVGTPETPRVIVPRAQAPGEDPDQPRRVRTLIVNPDGSIVRAPAVEAAPSTTAAVQPAPSSPEPAAPAVQPQPATVPNDATITEDANQPAEPETAVPVEPVAPVVPTETAEPEIAVEGDPSIPVPLSRPAGIRPQAASQPQAPVTRQTASAPRSISPPAVAQTAGSGPFVVQLASRRSQEQALSTYASLQNQFPGILGAYTPIIERADLGSRGVFYRLRVGPLGSQTAAANLCGQLRSAGLNDCLVQRN